MNYYSGKLILITGGSSGIGLAMAKDLFRSGAHVFLLARRLEALKIAQAEIEKYRLDSSQKLGIISADVSDEAVITRTITDFCRTVGTPDILINAAGVTQPGLFAEQDVAVFKEMMEINYFGVVYPTKLVIPGMLQRGSGYIINFSSVAGFLGVYGYAAYGASKFAVKGFSDALRAEMKQHGVKVSIVFPSDTDTPQLAYEKDLRPFITNELAEGNVMSAEKVSHLILKAIAKGHYIITPGLDSTLYYFLVSTIGLLTYVVMDLLIYFARKKEQKPK